MFDFYGLKKSLRLISMFCASDGIVFWLHYQNILIKINKPLIEWS